MLLDDIQNIYEEYHLIGCLVTVATLTLIFKIVFGKCGGIGTKHRYEKVTRHLTSTGY